MIYDKDKLRVVQKIEREKQEEKKDLRKRKKKKLGKENIIRKTKFQNITKMKKSEEGK